MALVSQVSGPNSTTTPLDAGVEYAGDWEDVAQYASISLLGAADQEGTLFGEFSHDGVTRDRSVQLNDPLLKDFGVHTLIPVARFFRMRVIAGRFDQATLRIQTTYHFSARIAMPTSRAAQSINQFADVLNTRAILTGESPDGDFHNVGITERGSLDVAVDPAQIDELLQVGREIIGLLTSILAVGHDVIGGTSFEGEM